MIVLTHEGMGQGPLDLQQKVLKTWLALMAENQLLPGAIAFYTEGVKLMLDDSPLLDAFLALEAQGVHLIVCKTCLDYFSGAQRLGGGVIGGMGDIQAAMATATKVLFL